MGDPIYIANLISGELSLCYVSLQQKWVAKPMIIYTFAKKGRGGGLSLLSYVILQKKKVGGVCVSLFTHSPICISYKTYEIDYCSLFLSFQTKKSGVGVG